MIFQSADIYWFSGTGNTLLVARKTAETLSKRGVDVRLLPLVASDPQNVEKDRALGIAVPVAMQGTYSFVWSFVKGLPATSGTPVFLIDTLLGYSGGILYPMKRMLQTRGYNPVGATEILMPSNIFLKQGMTDKKSTKINKGLQKAEEFTEKLIQGKTYWIDIPGYSNLLSSISRSEGFWRFCRGITPPSIDKSHCTNCGLCIKLCPVDNIKAGEPPQHQDLCQFCMRCFSYCPQNAVCFEHYTSAQYRAVESGQLL